MCGSKLDRESGVVTITTPSPGCSVGDTLAVRGSAAEFMVERIPDWVLRVLDPPPAKPQAVNEPDARAAELASYKRLGLMPEPLVETQGEAA